MSKRLVIVALLLALCGLAWAAEAPELYSQGVELFHLGRWADAAERLAAALELGPRADFAADARFKLAECRYRQGDLEGALAGFREYVANYPLGINRRAAEQRIATLEQALGRIAQAPPLVPGQLDRIRAVRFETITFDNWPAFETCLLELRRSGVNALIVRVYQQPLLDPHALFAQGATSGVYFPTQDAPLSGDLTTRLVQICHKYGLRLYGRMTTLDCHWLAAADPVLTGAAWDFDSRTLVRTTRLDPFNQQALQRLEALFEELGAGGVDGIVLADDWRLAENEGFSLDGLATYANAYGTQLDPAACFSEVGRDAAGRHHVLAYSDEYLRFAELKAQQLLELAERLRAAARKRNPGCTLAVELAPLSLLDPAVARARLGHDFELAAAADLDLLLVRLHNRRLQRELALTGQDTFSLMRRIVSLAIARVKDPGRLLVELQVVDPDSFNSLPDWEIEAALESISGAGPIGVSLAPYATDIKWQDILKALGARAGTQDTREVQH